QFYPTNLSSAQIQYLFNNPGKVIPPDPLPDPYISEDQPADTLAALGGTANFTVTPTGTGPFTYQWQFYGTNITAVVSTSQSLVLTNLQTNQAGPYSVIVSNSAGHFTSYPAILTVDSLPPTLVSAVASIYANTVSVLFSETLKASSANTAS